MMSNRFHLRLSKQILFLLAALLLIVLSSCTAIWGAWDNPLDPDVMDYVSPSPFDTDETNSTKPLLDWSDLTGAVSYELQLADTSAELGSTTVITVNSSKYQVPTVLIPGTWYWRVRAKKANGTYGVWWGTWSFTVVELLNMVNVTGGTFNNGTANMTVSSFRMGKYEVTQAEYNQVMGENPSAFSTNAHYPVERVTWFDAIEFCNKLSEMYGYYPVYTILGRTPDIGYPITSATVSSNWTKNGYRLPTEAEWEFAARGGISSAGYSCAGSDNVHDVAWHQGNSNNRTHVVGTKAPNELGIYDMNGNVNEWCWDWFGDYPSSAQTDYYGPSSGISRVVRGGAWYMEYPFVDCEHRFHDGSGGGFRVVRRP